jgi:hypothetical protein
MREEDIFQKSPQSSSLSSFPSVLPPLPNTNTTIAYHNTEISEVVQPLKTNILSSEHSFNSSHTSSSTHSTDESLAKWFGRSVFTDLPPLPTASNQSRNSTEPQSRFLQFFASNQGHQSESDGNEPKQISSQMTTTNESMSPGMFGYSSSSFMNPYQSIPKSTIPSSFTYSTPSYPYYPVIGGGYPHHHPHQAMGYPSRSWPLYSPQDQPQERSTGIATDGSKSHLLPNA